ncbi:hypothetical protein CAPI_00110 [Corynebacterium capitovis DSM 44611]|uniref:hypothetical protein n=1 Tax=Corynebacterium capitovis TaxID=131081 RepID=UPI00036E7B04|nr:hypothetical protein [Corynebacterium capitovis]WKD56610.1 hypothetical protein CAPI_00110 [Corynebacterium capitovis DSM 44611]
MNLTTANLALKGAKSAYNYVRKLDDEKQRDIYDAIIGAIKDNNIDRVHGVASLPELEELYGAARAQAGDVTRAAHDRLDRRRAAFTATAPDRAARRAALKKEAKGKKRGFGALGVLAALAVAGGAAWAAYTYLSKKGSTGISDLPTRPAAPREETDEAGRATLVYSTKTEDDRATGRHAAGPLGEEPAERDEELLTSLEEQLTTLDTLDKDQRS